MLVPRGEWPSIHMVTLYAGPKSKKAQRKRANLQQSTLRDLEQPVTLVGSTTPSPSSWPLGPRRELILFKISYRTLVFSGRVCVVLPFFDSCPMLLLLDGDYDVKRFSQDTMDDSLEGCISLHLFMYIRVQCFSEISTNLGL